MRSFINRLGTIIEPGERSLVLLLLLLSFTMGGALVFVDIAARALFLDQFPAEQLPYAYLGAAFVIPLVGVTYTRLQRRLAMSTLSILTTGFLLITVIALWAEIAFNNAAWPVFTLFIWYRLFYAFNGILFWGLAGQLFSLRQGKRLFGLVGTGEPIAGILGYFSAALLALWIGTINMLLITVVGLGLSLVLLILLARAGKTQLTTLAPEDAAPAGEQQATRSGPGRYGILIIIIAIGAILNYLFADYAFSAESRLVFTSTEQLASFFALFFGVVAIGRIVARSILSSWVLNRFGLRIGLLALPLAFGLSSIALILVGGMAGIAGSVFVLASTTRFLGSILQPSIQRTSVQLLYQPLSARQRLATLSLVEGIIEPVAIGAGSLLLIGLTNVPGFNTLALAGIMLVISLIWIVVAGRVMRYYRETLGRALARRLLEGSTLSLTDASSRTVIERALGSPHPGEVIYAINLLERTQPHLLAQRLPELLVHPDPQVRREAAKRIGSSANPQLIEQFQHAFEHETNADVRATMVQVLGGMRDSLANRAVLQALDDPSPHVHDAALITLLRSDHEFHIEHVQILLQRMFSSPKPDERARAAAVIGRLPSDAWASELIQLISDSDSSVRRSAIRAASRRSDAATLAHLLTMLPDPTMRGAVVQALARRGAAAPTMQSIATAFSTSDQSPALLIRLTTICGRVRGEIAAAMLIQQLAYPHDGVRHAVVLALRRCGYQATGPQAQQVRTQIRREAGHTAWMLAAAVAIGNNPHVALLRDALTVQVARIEQRIFALLELIYEPRAIRRIHYHLHSPLVTKRDYAYELFELHVEGDIRKLLMPLISDAAYTTREYQLRELFNTPIQDQSQWLLALLREPGERSTSWIRASALVAAQNIGRTDLVRTMTDQATRDPLVGETASWILQQTRDQRQPNRQLVTIEKVLILKTVSIFAATPDDILAEIAGLTTQIDLPAETPIFAKDDHGDTMYIIIDGQVRIHDGEQIIGNLSNNEVFGEMALLDSTPRVASATTDTHVRLLRLDQEPFYELMDDQIEIARGIIRVLNQRLRSSIAHLHEARNAGILPNS
ncbi:MAG: HEAT repeat domain-containing protein [Roseiflexaceae bacterium]|nr:HEAT repeat domain-containing protein [Roseiflexaceae bacterium]